MKGCLFPSKEAFKRIGGPKVLLLNSQTRGEFWLNWGGPNKGLDWLGNFKVGKEQGIFLLGELRLIGGEGLAQTIWGGRGFPFPSRGLKRTPKQKDWD